jgi:hypothetical protein
MEFQTEYVIRNPENPAEVRGRAHELASQSIIHFLFLSPLSLYVLISETNVVAVLDPPSLIKVDDGQSMRRRLLLL